MTGEELELLSDRQTTNGYQWQIIITRAIRSGEKIVWNGC